MDSTVATHASPNSCETGAINRQLPVPSRHLPLHFALGEAFQFDWSEEWLVIGGIHRKILAAHTKLCASRAFMICAYPTQSHEMLFDAHTRSFTALGGVTKRGIYDNMKSDPCGIKWTLPHQTVSSEFL